MELKKRYLVSSDLDYRRSISPAAGPIYAERMGWPVTPFDEVIGDGGGELADEGEWIVVDNRLSERECAELPEFIGRNVSTRFLLKVIDPYYEWCQGHPYYRMLFEVARRPNVWFLSPYVPKELVADLDRASGGGRLAVVPYPYPLEFEQPVGGGRRPQVIFSGNQHRDVYPFRYRFGRLARWWPPLGRRVEVLEHPGYPDIGHEKRHDVVGARYVEHLARYTHMFLSPSRCRLEFLKYGECAAAGCLPVGQRPDGFDPDLAAPFVDLDFESAFRLARSTRRALQMPTDEAAARVGAYREAFRRLRSAEVLNERLDAFLSAASTGPAA